MIKEEILDLIQRLPDGVTKAEILQALHFRLQVERGFRDAVEGRVLSPEVLKRRIAERRSSSS